MDALASGEATTVAELTTRADAVRDDHPVGEVLRRLDRGEDAVPIADASGHLVGWIRMRDMLAALSLRP